MNLRPVIAVSLVANLGLTGAVLYQAALVPPGEPPRAPTLSFTKTVTRVEGGAPRAAAPTLPEGAAAAFHWRQVEAEDYPTYIANLRAIGCPAATIRDIVLADANDQFTRQRAALLAPMQAQFWALAARAPGGLDELGGEPLKSLRAGHEQLKKDLLALIGAPEPAKPDREAGRRQLFSFLPPEKQAQARQSGTNDAALRQLLTPAEFEEYRLRSSRHSHWADDVFAFEPSENELRAVTRMKLGFDEAMRTRSDRAEREMEEQIKAVLGQERFTEYLRAQDPEYRLAHQVAGRYALPPEAAVQVMEVKKIAERNAAELRAQSGLADDERLAEFEKIQTETELSLKKTLGDAAWRTYQRYSGDWLKTLPVARSSAKP
jgi:hypothetical protein